MANRRMFSLDVVDTDSFLDMPLTAQVLYFHLGMRADDDGFISNPKRVQRMVGCNDDDLKLLLAKGFIIPFESGVCVIRHWKVHNYIRSDRYKKTAYRSEMERLLVLENGEYSLMDAVGIPDDNQTAYQMETQVRIGKVNNNICAPDEARECQEEEKAPLPSDKKASLRKDKKAALQKDREDFEKIYAVYPRKKGKEDAFKHYLGFVGEGRVINGTRYHLSRKQIYLAVAAYAKEQKAAGTEIDYCQYFSTFMNKTILDYLPEEEDT